MKVLTEITIFQLAQSQGRTGDRLFRVRSILFSFWLSITMLIICQCCLNCFCFLFHATVAGPQQTRHPLDWTQRVKIAFDVAKGLECIHDRAKLVHGNIQSNNILIFDDQNAKILDFSISQSSNQHYTGNKQYHAPK